MEPIREGATGAAVEDIQERLVATGQQIDAAELEARRFGPSTATAVGRFRLAQGLTLDSCVDTETWSALVDEGYQLGDRTLYLRLPKFHGSDVRTLQTRLNILGFSCGEADGYYGAYTESAVKQFQESQGALADGMCFQDTFDAIDRLHHVWGGKPASGPHPMGGMGFARAADVLESMSLQITGEDPISRSIAGRVWNLASATTEESGLELINTPEDARSDIDVLFIVATTPLPTDSPIQNVTMDDVEALPMRIRVALDVTHKHNEPQVLRIELPLNLGYDGSFTAGDSQTFAVMLLDAICAAFALPEAN
ncbi:peptidoglycan-binding protein [Atopobium sp. oral taxon 810]|uniref:peptidoglycan-binding domain-containing protein n=1 Tax=Atopobium sp. oral taxon 810 TaxID=712158 RepID=UPI000395ED09|nr:peptidoglycan-binding protein [Atopobium sp. oral taxon 810]ERI05364.1 peptidoglycan binding domain protein [Atopobium sp. oral taxon 810 str. F0209]